ncbi:alpha/beta hydrolase [Bacteroidales bacterium OttesenSCG-928-A17]|nr:alpha/beta hydrolase [Bacteroidales bacterium OttesenSCG-928-A17]
MKKLILLLLCLSCLKLYAIDEEIIMEVDGIQLHATLHFPSSVPHDTKLPVALIIPGSGPTDRNGNNPQMTNNSLKFLAQGLQEHGIATLNYDKRGIAESAIPDFKEEDLSFEDYIRDVQRWIKFLDKDPEFTDIIVIGHSEGSLIGMCAVKDNPKVAAFISIAGVGDPADEILKTQIKAQSPILLEMVSPMIDKLKQGELLGEVDPMLNTLFRPSVQPYLISWFKYTPTDIMKELTLPTLIINGTTDIQVGTDQAELLAKANPKAQLTIIENMNHVLKETTETNRLAQLPIYNNPDLPLAPELIPAITDWLKKNVYGK